MTGPEMTVRQCVCGEDDQTIRLTMVENPDGTGLRVELTFWYDFDEFQVHWAGRTAHHEPVSSCDQLIRIMNSGTCFVVDCLGLRKRV